MQESPAIGGMVSLCAHNFQYTQLAIISSITVRRKIAHHQWRAECLCSDFQIECREFRLGPSIGGLLVNEFVCRDLFPLYIQLPEILDACNLRICGQQCRIYSG